MEIITAIMSNYGSDRFTNLPISTANLKQGFEHVDGDGQFQSTLHGAVELVALFKCNAEESQYSLTKKQRRVEQHS
jgi:hypothetical protein